eukprot:499031-Prymnesium_polylepis.2
MGAGGSSGRASSRPGGVEAETLREAFRIFDKDGDGRLQVEEVMAILTHPKGNRPFTQKEAQALVARYDTNQDCVLDFQ